MRTVKSIHQWIATASLQNKAFAESPALILTFIVNYLLCPYDSIYLQQLKLRADIGLTTKTVLWVNPLQPYSPSSHGTV